MATETALTTETTNSFDPNKIAADVTTTLITEAIKSGWQKVKNFFQDLDAKDSIDYGDAYEDYLKNTVDKNSQIKTLIYRHVPKFLYSFYEYPDIQYKDQTISTSNAQDILDLNNKLIVTGIGGIGKSLLLKHFFLNIAQYGHYIPVLIELRKFNQLDSKEICLYDAIYQNLSDNGFKLEDKYYRYSLDAGGYVILLDAFDEVNRDKAQKVFDQIESFSQRYNKNHFIVSSRPSDRFMGWNDFHELTLCGLVKQQALDLIQKIEFDETIKKPFSNALDSELFDTYKSFASNPLLLTIMLLTFSNHATLPRNLNDFYDQAFTTLFNGQDATKDYFVRDIRSDFSCEEFKKVFAYICICSYFESVFEFSDSQIREYIQRAEERVSDKYFLVSDFKEDLVSSVCMLVKDGLNYRFIHRSFQEYFAAWYTCKLSDIDQQDILKEWISKSSTSMSDNYISMLFEFQKDKVNKIVFCPTLEKLKTLYTNNKISFNLIEKLFSDITIAYVDGQNDYLTLIPTVKDNYLHNIIEFTCKLNKYPVYENNEYDKKEQEILQRIMLHVIGQRSFGLSLEKALYFVTADQLLYCFRDLDRKLQFCFAIYNKYNHEKTALKERNISSIIANI